ncbi:hypothetical protein ACYSNR_14100 [Enterococcus sp. LJL128]
MINAYLFDKEIADEGESGYRVQVVAANETEEGENLFKKRIKKNIDNGYPSFAAVDLNKLYPDLPRANHMILIVGYATYKNSEEIAFYYINDPYPLVQDPVFGNQKIVPEYELFEAITRNEEPAYIW